MSERGRIGDRDSSALREAHRHHSGPQENSRRITAETNTEVNLMKQSDRPSLTVNVTLTGASRRFIESQQDLRGVSLSRLVNDALAHYREECRKRLSDMPPQMEGSSREQ